MRVYMRKSTKRNYWLTPPKESLVIAQSIDFEFRTVYSDPTWIGTCLYFLIVKDTTPLLSNCYAVIQKTIW